MEEVDVAKPAIEEYRFVPVQRLPSPSPRPEPKLETPWVVSNRALAVLMQVKDTANILLMLASGALLFGIFFGIGIPGLILYALRWRQVKRPVVRAAVLVQAGLSVAHEVFWALYFQNDITSTEPMEHSGLLSGLYWLGAGLSAIQLLLVASTWVEVLWPNYDFDDKS